MATVWNVKQLRVYQHILKLLPLLYELVYSIPEAHQKMRRQILSCGEGMAPLIAEGFAKRRNTVEFLRFVEMAMGESDELITHLEQVKILSDRFKTIKLELCQLLIDEYTVVSKELFNLRRNWNNNSRK